MKVISLSCLLQKVLFGLWAVGSDTVRGWTFHTEISMENFQMRSAGWGDPPHGLLLVPSQTSLDCSNEWKWNLQHCSFFFFLWGQLEVLAVLRGFFFVTVPTPLSCDLWLGHWLCGLPLNTKQMMKPVTIFCHQPKEEPEAWTLPLAETLTAPWHPQASPGPYSPSPHSITVERRTEQEEEREVVEILKW